MTRNSSLKQVFVAYLCVTVVVVVLLSLYGSYMARTFHLDQTAEDLEARARLCSQHMVELIQQDETDKIDALCKELGETVQTRITVIRPTGEVIGDTEESPHEMENHKERPEIKEAIESPDAVGRSTRFSATLKEHTMYVAVAASDGGTPVVVRASTPVTDVKMKRDLIDRFIIVLGFVAVVIITAVSPMLSLRIGRPTVEPESGTTQPSNQNGRRHHED